jgi:GWxTD domain-containing protein
MKRILSFMLMLCLPVLGQMRPPMFRAPVMAEILVSPAEKQVVISYNYKIPYNKLIFEKADKVFKSAFRIMLEVTDSKGNFVIRQSKEGGITVKSFSETDSPFLFAEGNISLTVDSGSYKIIPIFRDLKTPDEIRMKDIELHTSSYLSKNILAPIIVNTKKDLCGNKSLYTLANLSGDLPFDESSYDLLFPVSDTTVKSIEITAVNNEDTVYKGKLSNFFYSSNSIAECSGKLSLDNTGSGTQCKNFILTGISNMCNEGSLILSVSRDLKEKPRVFKTEVKWYSKPVSLSDPKMAIQALKIIESDDTVKAMLDVSRKDQFKVLFNYWKKHDPNPASKYNPVMAEYYKRVDYAIQNFSSLDKKNGALTDRGRIFVKFGQPSNIERTSSGDNKIVEIWSYINPKVKYYFIDKKGVGDFELMKE